LYSEFALATICFFSLRHFGHLSRNGIKSRHNIVHQPPFPDIVTESNSKAAGFGDFKTFSVRDRKNNKRS